MKQKKNILEIIKENKIIIIFFLIALLGMGYSLFKNGFSFWKFDLYMYWKSNAYAIRGYDLYKCITGEVTLDSIGVLDVSLTLPWARFYSNLIVPGFLSWNVCIYYFYILWFLLTCIAFVLTINKFSEIGEIGKYQKNVLTSVIILSPFYWQDALNTGNMGGVLCIIAYIGILLTDTNPLIASFCFSIVCVKPQIGALFIFLLLVIKKYKQFLYSIIILITNMFLGEMYVALMSKNIPGIESILDLFRKVIISPNYGNGVTPSFYSYGIFDPLNIFGVDRLVVSILSALAGIIFVIVINNLIPKSMDNKNKLIVMGAVASLASVFWSYKTPCDEVIMISCNLLLIFVWINSEKSLKDGLLCILCLVSFNCKVNRFWLYHLISMPYRWAIFADSVIRIVAMIILIFMIKKQYLDKNETVYDTKIV